jgi:hypothetical protein
MASKLDFKKIVIDVAWWGGVIGLLILSQIRNEYFLFLVQKTRLSYFFAQTFLQENAITIATIITPIRGILLLCSVTALVFPIIQSIRKSEFIGNSHLKGRHVLQVIFLFIILCVLFLPGEISGLAEEYANTSLVMFTRVSTVSYHQRFLMPALANILFFRGRLFFLIFSFVCTLLSIFVLRLWFVANQISVSTWQLVSLGTISFINFQIQTPGYPDVLVNIFILLAFIFKLDTKAKLSLFVLSLASHEAGIFIWFALAFLLFDVKGFAQFLIICMIYILLFLTANDGISGLLALRQVGETSGLMWIMNYPAREVLGIFFGLRGLWGIVIGAIVFLYTQKNFKEVFQILVILLTGVLLTFLAVDTSRLFGWTFMAVLISWKILERAEGAWKKLINIALIANLLIPPVNVLLIMNPYIPYGLYQYIYNSLFGY